jgi:[acyl-carrier-protein] S-malonyltransferase
MAKIAFLFPGQGSQAPGMGLDFISEVPAAKKTYDTAKEILGWSVEDVSQPDNADTVNQTLYTQPALYTLSCVIAEQLLVAGLTPGYTAGHSAGEYAALTVSGVWDFETGLKVIAERARLMHEKAAKGAMAAVMGLSPDVLQTLCEEHTEGLVRVANFNTPMQTVITGDEKGIDSIAPVLKEHGARRVLKLNVSGAFHSPLMADAQTHFADFMNGITIKEPTVPWISNHTAAVEANPDAIREQIVAQFSSPVRWVETMALLEKNCDTALEVGPGAVLKGLSKACCEKLVCETTASLEGVRKVLDDYGFSA